MTHARTPSRPSLSLKFQHTHTHTHTHIRSTCSPQTLTLSQFSTHPWQRFCHSRDFLSSNQPFLTLFQRIFIIKMVQKKYPSWTPPCIEILYACYEIPRPIQYLILLSHTQTSATAKPGTNKRPEQKNSKEFEGTVEYITIYVFNEKLEDLKIKLQHTF